jgi:hypothetical protein
MNGRFECISTPEHEEMLGFPPEHEVMAEHFLLTIPHLAFQQLVLLVILVLLYVEA